MVTFGVAPSAGIIVTIERRVPLERITDFLEGGDFSAISINNELDYLAASIQQVNRDTLPMLRYSDHETPSSTIYQTEFCARTRLWALMEVSILAVFPEGSMASPDYTAPGTGSITRTSLSKLSN